MVRERPSDPTVLGPRLDKGAQAKPSLKASGFTEAIEAISTTAKRLGLQRSHQHKAQGFSEAISQLSGQ